MLMVLPVLTAPKHAVTQATERTKGPLVPANAREH
jgi:hypothetical protein